MPMTLIETTISKTAVRMRYADNAETEMASEWLEFVVPLSPLELPREPLGDPKLRTLAEVQLAALRRVRDVVGGETQRLSELAGHIQR